MAQEVAISKTVDCLGLILISMRPRQWLKNGFLSAPLLFSKNMFHPAKLAASLFACAVFCPASGAVYLLNDLLDMEQDRNHSKKRSRPLTSGALDPETIAKFGTSRLWLTIPIVLYGISRYLYRVYRHGDGGQPEEFVWKDKPLLMCVAVYIVSVVLILHLHSGSLS